MAAEGNSSGREVLLHIEIGHRPSTHRRCRHTHPTPSTYPYTVHAFCFPLLDKVHGMLRLGRPHGWRRDRDSGPSAVVEEAKKRRSWDRCYCYQIASLTGGGGLGFPSFCPDESLI